MADQTPDTDEPEGDVTGDAAAVPVPPSGGSASTGDQHHTGDGKQH